MMGALRGKWKKGAVGLCLALSCLFFPALGEAARGASTAIQLYLPVEQVFTSQAATAASAVFTYSLTALNVDNPMPAGSQGGVYTFFIDGTGSFDVGPITFESEGEYYYLLQQVVPREEEGYTYDRQVYTVNVYVVMGSAGLEGAVTIQIGSGDKVSAIVFENSYAPEAPVSPIEVDLTVQVVVIGAPIVPETFIFVLVAEDEAHPMPPGSVNGRKEISIEGGGQVNFGIWSYSEPGVYHYTVYQVNAGEEGYTYDTMVYSVTDVVTLVNGRLVLARSMANSQGLPISVAVFVNRYSAGGEAPAQDSGESAAQTGDTALLELYRISLYASGGLLLLCGANWLARRRGKKKGNGNHGL